MSKFWSDVVHTLTPYVPGEQPKLANLIKLNTNENPYPPSDKVLLAVKSTANEALKLYPDPNSDKLKTTIAQYHSLNNSQVFVGNGSDEVLAHVFHAFFKQDKPLLFPDITYSFYPVYCQLYGIQFEKIALNNQFEIHVNDYAKPNGGIIFPNPNAPTGIPLALTEIERMLKANTQSVVVVDEAYVDFGTESAVGLINQFPNLLVTHTLSKSRSLAGLRVGYALGHADLIEGLHRVKDSFNSYPIDRLAEAGAIAAFEDEAYFQLTREQIIATRENLVHELRALNFDILPSGANFVFAKHATYNGADLTAKLRERNIIVRHFKAPVSIAPFLRISIGNNVEMNSLIEALRLILAS